MLCHEINRWNKGRKEQTREGNSLNRNSKKKHNSRKRARRPQQRTSAKVHPDL